LYIQSSRNLVYKETSFRDLQNLRFYKTQRPDLRNKKEEKHEEHDKSGPDKIIKFKPEQN